MYCTLILLCEFQYTQSEVKYCANTYLPKFMKSANIEKQIEYCMYKCVHIVYKKNKYTFLREGSTQVDSLNTKWFVKPFHFHTTWEVVRMCSGMELGRKGEGALSF